MKGFLHQEIYTLIGGGDYQLWDVSCKEGDHDNCGSMRWTPILLADMTLKAGSRYDVRDWTYHRVRAENCITKLEITTPTKERAGVLRKVGSKPVCPFSKKVPEDTLWEIVEDMLTA